MSKTIRKGQWAEYLDSPIRTRNLAKIKQPSRRDRFKKAFSHGRGQLGRRRHHQSRYST